jgi:excisionase family DNA binding protein
MPPDEPPKLESDDIMRLPEVCAYLRIHPTTAYRMLRRRELPAFKIGADWRFSRRAIDEWRLNRQTGPEVYGHGRGQR